jgi:phosphinothricin acetyltransferase
MQIRHADPERDAAACAAIYAPYVRDTVISFEQRPPTEAEFADRIERYSRSHAWLVAEAEGRVVDVSVYVDRACHRRGFGRRLYAELLELLRRQGIYTACAGVTLPNDASVGLHEALGFKPVGVYRRIGFKAGAWWDVGWWQLELRPASDEAPAESCKPSGD